MKEEKSKQSNGELEKVKGPATKNESDSDQENRKEKPTCFVIMPISDVPSYEPGHFNRVFEYIIKPACINAGYDPIRADEVRKTNYIVLDIVRKIVESDMVVCDLSSRNPNVLYELGIRQAFNKLAVLIKDDRTDRIFDIQGLRTTDYDSSLRIDKVSEAVKVVTSAIEETRNCKDEDVNSLIQLLSIQPARLPEHVQINADTHLILSVIQDLSNKLNSIQQRVGPEPPEKKDYFNEQKILTSKHSLKITNWIDIELEDYVYWNDIFIGKVKALDNDGITVEGVDGTVLNYPIREFHKLKIRRPTGYYALI